MPWKPVTSTSRWASEKWQVGQCLDPARSSWRSPWWPPGQEDPLLGSHPQLTLLPSFSFYFLSPLGRESPPILLNSITNPWGSRPNFRPTHGGQSHYSWTGEQGRACIFSRLHLAAVFQVYPTATRALGLGTCSGMARVGALITPFIAQVGCMQVKREWVWRKPVQGKKLLRAEPSAEPSVCIILFYPNNSSYEKRDIACRWEAGGLEG